MSQNRLLLRTHFPILPHCLSLEQEDWKQRIISIETSLSQLLAHPGSTKYSLTGVQNDNQEENDAGDLDKHFAGKL